MAKLVRQIDEQNEELFLDSEEDSSVLGTDYDNIIIFKLNENNRLQEEVFVV